MSSTPYDDAKKKWLSIAAFAVFFGLASVAVRYGPMLFTGS